MRGLQIRTNLYIYIYIYICNILKYIKIYNIQYIEVSMRTEI